MNDRRPGDDRSRGQRAPAATDARDAIRELMRGYENDFDPFRFKAAGFCVWPIYRFRVALRLLTFASGDNFSDPSVENRPSVGEAVLELARALPFELRGIYRASRGNTIVLGKSGPGWRRDSIDGRMMDMSFDLLEPALQKFTLSEACSSRQVGNPYPSIFDEYAYPFRAMMLPVYRREAARTECELLEDFSGCLRRSEYAASYGIPGDLSRLGLTARFMADRQYWRMVFKLTDPALFLVVCSYGQEAPVAAARSMGIPVWELQHGTISEFHFGYSYDASARAHSATLPLPERIITFGQFFSEALISCGYWVPEQVPVLGFPRLSYFQKAAASTGATPREGPFNILVSTQWTLEDEYHDFIRALVALLPARVKLIVNPHPRSLPRNIERLESLSGDRIEVMDQRSSMYHRLGEIDLHCSAYSTTLFESAGMGIPTIVMGLPGWTNVRSLLDRGAAKFAQDPAEFAATVSLALEQPAFLQEWKRRTEKEGSYFFEPFDIERARELLSPCARR